MSKFTDTLLLLHERKEYVSLAKACESAELYKEMAKVMVELIKRYARLEDLNVEERNLFAIANKNRMGALRAAWRILSSDECRAQPHVAKLREHVERKLLRICEEMTALCNDYLLGEATSKENKLAFNKMVGDYNRFVAEFMLPRERWVEASGRAYERAMGIGEAHFEPTNPIRLGLALNYSVYFYEIAHDRHRAVRLAKKAFDDAITNVDALPEASYKDATLIMQLLRDNLTLWASEDDDQTGG